MNALYFFFWINLLSIQATVEVKQCKISSFLQHAFFLDKHLMCLRPASLLRNLYWSVSVSGLDITVQYYYRQTNNMGILCTVIRFASSNFIDRWLKRLKSHNVGKHVILPWLILSHPPPPSLLKGPASRSSKGRCERKVLKTLLALGRLRASFVTLLIRNYRLISTFSTKRFN